MPPWFVNLLGFLFFAIQLVVLTASTSHFRLPKMALAVAGLALLASMTFALRLLRGKFLLPRSGLMAVLVTLPLVQVLSAAWAENPRRALATALVGAVWVAAILLLAGLERSEQRRLLGWTVVGAATSAGIMLAQAAGIPVGFTAGSGLDARFGLTGTAGNPGDMALTVTLLLPLLLVGLDTTARWWRWLLPGLFVVTVIVTKTITALIAIAAVAGVFLILRGSRRLWVIAAAGMLLVVILVLGSGTGTRLNTAKTNLRTGNYYAMLSARPDGWGAAVEMVRDHPLLGVGAGNYDHLYYPSRLQWIQNHGGRSRRGEFATHFEWAHCDPLQLIAEHGLLGLVWLVALLVALFRHRRPGDLLLPLATAVLIPLAVLGYPTHLAIGLLPLALQLAYLLRAAPTVDFAPPWPALRCLLALGLVVAGIAIVIHQGRILETDRWRQKMENSLVGSAQVNPVRRQALLVAIERQVSERITQQPADGAWLWRLLGRARFAHGDSKGAENAFRHAMTYWPHEEAELGLGLVLAAQGRRSEALHCLVRVCRTNTTLTKQIADPVLRKAVREVIAIRVRDSK